MADKQTPTEAAEARFRELPKGSAASNKAFKEWKDASASEAAAAQTEVAVKAARRAAKKAPKE